jgi:hypothetical protein
MKFVVLSRSTLWPCFLQKLTVEGVGEVQLVTSIFSRQGPKLELLDKEGSLLYQTTHTSWCSCRPTLHFKLFDCNGEEVTPLRSFNHTVVPQTASFAIRIVMYCIPACGVCK